MKGIELPVSIVIVVAISLLILIVIGAFFLTNSESEKNSMNTKASVAKACLSLASDYACGEKGLTDIKVNGITLAKYCENEGLSIEKCYVRCGCQPPSKDDLKYSSIEVDN